MDINELRNKVNEKRRQKGLVPLSPHRFVRTISVMQLDNKILVNNGDAEVVRDKSQDV